MKLEGRLVDTDVSVCLELDGPRVVHVEPVATAPERWLAPGFIDIQVNGYAGHDVNTEDVTAETVAQLVRALWAQGVTAVCPTVVTQSEERICHSLRAIAAACRTDPLVSRSIPCIHVEGPFISPEDGPRGAHPAEHVRPPSLGEYERWQAAADGRVGIITLAPEQPGALEFIRTVAAEGVVVALGHTGARTRPIQAAVEAGARLSTHLGNGAHASLPRHPNYIWDQLAEDRLYATFIFDGQHLPPEVMKVMLRAKDVERSILISDAVALAGLAPGVYETSIGGQVELLPSGRLVLQGTPYLAGSASSLPECIANAVRYTDITLGAAIRMVTTNPARLLHNRLRQRRDGVEAGGSADLTVFYVDDETGALLVDLTIVGGEVVFSRNAQ